MVRCSGYIDAIHSTLWWHLDCSIIPGSTLSINGV